MLVPSADKEEFHACVLCLQDLNEAHGVVAELHSKFFGLPHMFAVVKLLGSRSLPWLVRALLDYLSQKVNCIDPSSNKSTLYNKLYMPCFEILKLYPALCLLLYLELRGTSIQLRALTIFLDSFLGYYGILILDAHITLKGLLTTLVTVDNVVHCSSVINQ